MEEKGVDTLIDLQEITTGHVQKAPLQVKTCPVEGVIVYNDRAEVTRRVATHLNAGTTELSVSGLSSRIDTNSVRVSGGKGNAVILEVQFNSRWISKKEEGEVGRVKATIEELDGKIKSFEDMLARNEKEGTWVTSWAGTLSRQQPAVLKGASEQPPLFSGQMMEQAVQFMDFYQKRLLDVDERKATISASLKELQEQKARAQKSFAALNTGDREQVHEVIVLLTLEKEDDIELSLSYVVMGASWEASYDVRVQNGKTKLDLVYYGNITNGSNDDWVDAPLSLSTAKPSVGGAPPQLATKFIGIRQPYHNYAMTTRSAAQPQQQMLWNANIQSLDTPSAPYGAEEASFSDQSDLQVLTSEVKEGAICTSFVIPRRSTILSDNTPHKVTIRMIQLEAHFTYTIIPKQSLHAYLKASIMNTSENYPFLPGDINVFMDGNFIAKSHIKAVAPNESFSIFLGTDDGIKVTYPPGVHYKETQGLLRKSNLKTLKYQITVKNSKNMPVTCNIFDQLPKPNDSQIKVRLVKPEIKEGDTEVTLTEANSVKWRVSIPAARQAVLPFEYQVEWPVGVELTDF